MACFFHIETACYGDASDHFYTFQMAQPVA